MRQLAEMFHVKHRQLVEPVCHRRAQGLPAAVSVWTLDPGYRTLLYCFT